MVQGDSMASKDEIRGELVKVGSSQRAIARELGISNTTVCRILDGSYPQRQVRSRRTRLKVLQLVSDKTGLAMSELEEMTTAAAVAA
jgi:predicted transcriptional regulator